MAIASTPVETIPLRVDESGTMRIADTRVTLDVFATVFRQGATPEQIADQFPGLQLPDVYAVATWILRHPQAVSEYLARREQEADGLRRKVESQFPAEGFRARLASRARSSSDE